MLDDLYCVPAPGRGRDRLADAGDALVGAHLDDYGIGRCRNTVSRRQITAARNIDYRRGDICDLHWLLHSYRLRQGQAHKVADIIKLFQPG